jgi:hypothetical protein
MSYSGSNEDYQQITVVGGIIKRPYQNEKGWFVYRLRSTQQNASSKRTLYFNVLVNPKLQENLNNESFSQVKVTGVLCPPTNYEDLPTLADIIADNFEDIRPNINIKNTNDYKNNFDYTTIRNTNSYKKFSLKKQTYNNQMSNLKENDTLDSNFKETT